MSEPINKPDAVKNLQKYLRKLSFYGFETERVPIDGIYDSATRNAVTEFQRIHGLPETGDTDSDTWNAIFDEYMLLIENERKSLGLFLFPNNSIDYSVVLGDRLLLVNIIQLLLSELRVAYDIFDDIIESGIYDAETSDGIRKFQEINGLEATGEVDRATWNRIVREYSNIGRREELT